MTLTAYIRCQASTSALATGSRPNAPPALFTSTSSFGPTSAARASMSASEVTSQVRARPPISAANSCDPVDAPGCADHLEPLGCEPPGCGGSDPAAGSGDDCDPTFTHVCDSASSARPGPMLGPVAPSRPPGPIWGRFLFRTRPDQSFAPPKLTFAPGISGANDSFGGERGVDGAGAVAGLRGVCGTGGAPPGGAPVRRPASSRPRGAGR